MLDVVLWQWENECIMWLYVMIDWTVPVWSEAQRRVSRSQVAGRIVSLWFAIDLWGDWPLIKLAGIWWPSCQVKVAQGSRSDPCGSCLVDRIVTSVPTTLHCGLRCLHASSIFVHPGYHCVPFPHWPVLNLENMDFTQLEKSYLSPHAFSYLFILNLFWVFITRKCYQTS